MKNMLTVRFQFSSPGLGKTGQYQMSGIPFASASILVPQGGEGHCKVAFHMLQNL
jgi:hypothetical protein